LCICETTLAGVKAARVARIAAALVQEVLARPLLLKQATTVHLRAPGGLPLCLRKAALESWAAASVVAIIAAAAVSVVAVLAAPLKLVLVAPQTPE
jgi:hypothetical protein